LVDFRICEIPRVLVAAPAFLDRHGAPDHPRDLRDIPCLDYGNLEGGRTWRLATEGETVGVRPTSILCSNNGDVLRHAAMEGLGVTMLPLFLVSKDLQVGRLTQVLPDYQPPMIMLMATYPARRHLSLKVRLFTDFLIERFGDTAKWQ
ncbi:MAG: substrate binding domain-containing protein, partial [Rhodospirillaceae bacterium]